MCIDPTIWPDLTIEIEKASMRYWALFMNIAAIFMNIAAIFMNIAAILSDIAAIFQNFGGRCWGQSNNILTNIL